MNDKEIYNSIKSTVHSFLPDAQILLFGSRAKGKHNESSDYDLLIVTKETFTSGEKVHWIGKLNKALVKSIHMPVDVLMNSEEEVKRKRNLPGHIINWAVKEGIFL